jgi:hypothetical protein
VDYYYRSKKTKKNQDKNQKGIRPFYILILAAVAVISSFAGGVVFDRFYMAKVHDTAKVDDRSSPVSKVKIYFPSRSLGINLSFIISMLRRMERIID